MIEHNGEDPAFPSHPARDRRTAESAIKAVLVVAAVAGAILLFFSVLFIGGYALSG
ncbi:hypothetical protein [Streptomyces sp. NPDC020742]|uniref:hypothetical protein n=1 Tax=unclassified Streptomyces TaxID=2593676 RepID=UPI0033D8A30B